MLLSISRDRGGGEAGERGLDGEKIFILFYLTIPITYRDNLHYFNIIIF